MHEPQRDNPAAARRPTLETWEFAGLLVTYWCNARCAFCYVYSGPDRGGALSRQDALAFWRGLDGLAAADGRKMRIHLAGGEPFQDWPRLVGIVRAARDAGLSRLEKIETNAFWATEDNLTRARLELLAALGMEKLIVSADVYHQEFVPFERVKRCVVMARNALGRGRVRVRWWDFFNQPNDLRRREPAERQAAYQAALAHHPDRLNGRAAARLAPLLPLFPAEHFRGDHCVEPLLQSRHVHVDPYGNVFPGVCHGIILGNAKTAGVEALWHDLAENWPKHPLVGPLVQGGSFELMQHAKKLGYRELADGYADKCHLCSHVRQFMVDRGIHPQFAGPPECYAQESDRRELRADEAARVSLTVGGAPPA